MCLASCRSMAFAAVRQLRGHQPPGRFGTPHILQLDILTLLCLFIFHSVLWVSGTKEALQKLLFFSTVSVRPVQHAQQLLDVQLQNIGAPNLGVLMDLELADQVLRPLGSWGMRSSLAKFHWSSSRGVLSKGSLCMYTIQGNEKPVLRFCRATNHDVTLCC